MEVITLLFSAAKDAPGYFTLTLGFIAVVFALYLKVRSINVSEITSISKIQVDQTTVLLAQVKQLSSDLAAARDQINIMYHKVDELEDLVRVYRNKCDDCSYKKAFPVKLSS